MLSDVERKGNNIVKPNCPVVFELFQNYRSTDISLFTQRIISYVTAEQKQFFIIICDTIKHQLRTPFIWISIYFIRDNSCLSVSVSV